MQNIFKKENLKTLLITIVYFIVGVLFLTLLGVFVDFLESTLCFLLLFCGFACVVIYSLMSSDDKIYSLLIYGLIAIALGLLILFFRRFFGIALSIIIASGGVRLIIESLQQKKQNDKTWIMGFIIGVLICVLSITTIVLSGTNIAKNILAIFFGIMALIEAIYMLVELIVKSKTKIENQSETQE